MRRYIIGGAMMKCKVCGCDLLVTDRYWFQEICNQCHKKYKLSPHDDQQDECDMIINYMKEKATSLPMLSKKILLIEDGSVDTTKLDALGIEYIIYRQGSTPPRWIEA